MFGDEVPVALDLILGTLQLARTRVRIIDCSNSARWPGHKSTPQASSPWFVPSRSTSNRPSRSLAPHFAHHIGHGVSLVPRFADSCFAAADWSKSILRE
jgi:hypothetical protein